VDLDAQLAACAEIARRHDRERYLVALFAPASSRTDLLALLAANHEIAKTGEVVSEPMIGRIRLQWWRESFDGIDAGTPRLHEVVQPLADLAARHPGVLDHLRRVVDARETDLEDAPFADLDALAAYADATGGALAAAWAQVLGADRDAARAVGTGWALIGLARAMPRLATAIRPPLPQSLLQAADLTVSKIRDQPGSAPLEKLCRPIVDRARATLRSVPLRARRIRPLRLLAARAGDLATELERHGYDPRRLNVAPPPGLAWRHTARMALWSLGL
jgi:phytoene synthase